MTPEKKDSYKIVINWDPFSMWQAIFTAGDKYGADAGQTRALIEEIVDEHAKVGVDSLVHCVWAGFQTLMMPCKTSDPYNIGADGHPLVTNLTKNGDLLAKLDAAGDDYIEIVLKRCHDHKIKFLAGLRMNDRHAGSGECSEFYPWVQKLLDKNPEWCLEEFPGALDYKYEGVRDAVLAFIEEFLGRYDVDGLELDWMRWCHMFNTYEAVENAPFLTDFMRKARKLLDDAAAKRGREGLPLGVRIPQSIDECTGLGYDVSTWIKQGLVDFICPSDFFYTDYNCRVEDFVRLTEGTDCKVYPSIHPMAAWLSNRVMGGDEYRAAAKNFYAYGAHGVSPYNYQYHWAAMLSPGYPGPANMWPKAMSFLAELKSDEAIAKGNRQYLYHPLWSEHAEGHCPTRAYKNDRIILDRSADDPQGSFTFRLAEDLTDEKLCATLEFKVTYMIESDQLEIKINGQTIPADKVQTEWHIGQSAEQGRALGPYIHFHMPLSSGPIKCGDNELSVRLTNRVGMTKRMLNVQEFEVKVEVK